MIRRRTFMFVLAASVGLNLGLAGVLVYRTVNVDRYQRQARRDFESMRSRSNWSNTQRAHADSTRPFPLLEREQYRTLGEMRRSTEEEITPLRRQIQDVHKQIQEELLAAKPNPIRLDSLAAHTADLQRQIQVHLLDMIIRERAVLTQEQYEWVVSRMVPATSGGQAGPGRGGSDRGGRGGPDRGGDRDRGSNQRGGSRVPSPQGRLP